MNPTAYAVLAEWLAAIDARERCLKISTDDERVAALERFRAAWAAARACVAAGDVTVPREPTTVMVNEGVNVLRDLSGDIFADARRMWLAMHAVAPPTKESAK